MYTKRTISHTPAFPRRKDLIQHFLNELSAGGNADKWAHFELVETGGWFRNLLHGKAVWIEVLMAEGGFELNLGFLRKAKLEFPEIPERWPKKNTGIWSVPLIDSPGLAAWIDDYFNNICSNAPDRQLIGWIDGL